MVYGFARVKLQLTQCTVAIDVTVTIVYLDNKKTILLSFSLFYFFGGGEGRGGYSERGVKGDYMCLPSYLQVLPADIH